MYVNDIDLRYESVKWTVHIVPMLFFLFFFQFFVVEYWTVSEWHSELWQTSKMERFVKIVKGWRRSGVFIVKFEQIPLLLFIPLLFLFIVDFEQVNVSWVGMFLFITSKKLVKLDYLGFRFSKTCSLDYTEKVSLGGIPKTVPSFFEHLWITDSIMSVRGKAIVITLTEYVHFDRLDSQKVIFLLLIHLKFQKYELVIYAKIFCIYIFASM